MKAKPKLHILYEYQLNTYLTVVKKIANNNQNRPYLSSRYSNNWFRSK